MTPRKYDEAYGWNPGPKGVADERAARSAASTSDALREINVNGVQYFQASDVERWHRGLLAESEHAERLRDELRDAAMRIDAVAEAIEGALDDEGADLWAGTLRSTSLIVRRAIGESDE